MNEPPCIEVGSACDGRHDPGCFLDPPVWTRTVARSLARRDHHGPEADHWQLTEFVCKWYETGGSAPEARRRLKATGEHPGPEKGARRLLHCLFPDGSAPDPGRIAGMTMPRKVMLDV